MVAQHLFHVIPAHFDTNDKREFRPTEMDTTLRMWRADLGRHDKSRGANVHCWTEHSVGEASQLAFRFLLPYDHTKLPLVTFDERWIKVALVKDPSRTLHPCSCYCVLPLFVLPPERQSAGSDVDDV